MKRYVRISIYLTVLIWVLNGCATKSWQLADAEMDRVTIQPSSAKANPEIDAIIEPYKTQLDKKMNEVIGTVVRPMKKSKPECGLGNWMADAIMHYAKQESDLDIDFAIQNYGGIRIPEMQKGPLTVGKIFELMPFENHLVVITIDRPTMAAFVDRLVASKGWPVSRELQIQIAGDKLKSLTINGQDWTEKDQFVIALPDYVANGGSDCDFFIDAPRETYDLLIRDMLISYTQDVSSLIDFGVEGRTIVSKR